MLYSVFGHDRNVLANWMLQMKVPRFGGLLCIEPLLTEGEEEASASLIWYNL